MKVLLRHCEGTAMMLFAAFLASRLLASGFPHYDTSVEYPLAVAGPRAQPFQAPQGDLAVLAGSGNPLLAQAIATGLGVPLTPCRATFSAKGTCLFKSRRTCGAATRSLFRACTFR